eukprot:TRINITY_DN11659_c0_g1_i1.p1 TRINITY_DN11659_c0_g1~~TRINITY_DN11659_c0_g1_i1.p1  ORF type:complete len:227 (+),score=25.37 TRINITY_DN11659_c0_g1_i1:85-681(+)
MTTQSPIALKGSAELVTEFFGYGINSILYQRGIYPPEQFTKVQKYGLPILVTNNEGVRTFINNILNQLKVFLSEGTVQQVIITVTGVESRATIERWAFEIQTERGSNTGSMPTVRSEKEIQGEIQAIIRQICASVSFLPCLDDHCTFDVLFYADANTQTPVLWEESDPKLIQNAESVRLRSFDTAVHKVAGSVSYAKQ